MINKQKSSYYTDEQQTKVDQKVKTSGKKTKVKFKKTEMLSNGNYKTTRGKLVTKGGDVVRGKAKSIQKAPGVSSDKKILKDVVKLGADGAVKRKISFGKGKDKMKGSGYEMDTLTRKFYGIKK